MVTPIYLTHTSYVRPRTPFEDHGPTAIGRAMGFFDSLRSYRLLLQKLENQLGLLVGLRQHRDTGLFQHLRLGQVRRFRRKVGILNGAARLRQVLCSGLQVTDRGREAILDGAQLALETPRLSPGPNRRMRWCCWHRPPSARSGCASVAVALSARSWLKPVARPLLKPSPRQTAVPGRRR